MFFVARHREVVLIDPKLLLLGIRVARSSYYYFWIGLKVRKLIDIWIG